MTLRTICQLVTRQRVLTVSFTKLHWNISRTHKDVMVDGTRNLSRMTAWRVIFNIHWTFKCFMIGGTRYHSSMTTWRLIFNRHWAFKGVMIDGTWNLCKMPTWRLIFNKYWTKKIYAVFRAFHIKCMTTRPFFTRDYDFTAILCKTGVSTFQRTLVATIQRFVTCFSAFILVDHLTASHGLCMATFCESLLNKLCTLFRRYAFITTE